MIMKIFMIFLIGTGLFMILADCFRIPYMRTSKAVKNLAKQQKEKTSSIDVWLSSLASFIAKRLKLNEFKKARLEADLRTARMNISPEMFIANAVVKSFIIAVLAIPVLFIFPILSPIIIFLSFVLYKMNMKSIEKRIRRKLEQIEYELPRLVFKIEKTLTHSKDVLYIIESFAKNAGAELKHELDITAADMRSGAQEYFNTSYKRVQLGDKMEVTVSVETYVRGLGVFKIPITVTSHRSGISEKYWK